MKKEEKKRKIKNIYNRTDRSNRPCEYSRSSRAFDSRARLGRRETLACDHSWRSTRADR